MSTNHQTPLDELSVELHAPPEPPSPALPQGRVYELAHKAVHALAVTQSQFKAKVREAADGHGDHDAQRKAAIAARDRAADVRSSAQHVRALRDPARRRRLPLLVGAVLLATLLGADTPLLYWAAEAFDQSPAGTVIITGLLFAASMAVAVYLEAVRSHRRGVLVVVVVGYLALFALRTDFLVAVGGLGLVGAAVQAGLLTALSAGLLAAGITVLQRTVTPEIHKAEGAARGADRLAAQADGAEQDAAARCKRHIDALTAWLHAEAGGNVPHGVSFADWHEHLGQAIAARVGHSRHQQADPSGLAPTDD